jgi:hypothetical protein
VEEGTVEEVKVMDETSTPSTKDNSAGVSATRTVHTSLVVGPDEVMTTTEIESIKEAFSDEVSVSIDPHDPDTGLIVPHFKDGDGEAFRYLLVPLEVGSHETSATSNGMVPVDESEN